MIEAIEAQLVYEPSTETRNRKMKMIELSTASKPLFAYADEFDDETIVLTLHGKAIAVVTAIKDVDPESLSLSTNPEFLAIIQNARQEFKAGRKLSLEEMKKEILQ